MEAAGIQTLLIHAFKRTGLLVSRENWPLLSAEDRAESQAALEESDALGGPRMAPPWHRVL